MDRRTLGWILLGTGAAITAGAIYYSRKKNPGGGGEGEKILAGNLGRSKPSPVGKFVKNGYKLTHFRKDNLPIKERVAILQDLIHRSVQDPEMRKLALKITRKCEARDSKCESRAIYNWVKKNVRYTGDIAPHKLGRNGPVEGIDLFQSAARTVEFGGGDCLPLSTLVLKDTGVFAPIANIRPGDRIMADGEWTTVDDSWLTGEKPILIFSLSNGCDLRCSPDHKVFRVVGGEIEEVRAEDIRPGDDLYTPDRLPVTENGFGSDLSSFDKLNNENLHWLLGLYVADGWKESYRFAIAGKDGHPKEEQKRIVQSMMEAIDVNTRWHERYIAINDRRMAEDLESFGSHAANKHLPSVRFNSVADVEAVLRGLRADEGIATNGKTFVHSTTSPALALQLRALYRMVGQSTHIRRVENHGGLGSHPIYRVTVRNSPEKRLDLKWNRVRGIRVSEPEMCMDITVKGGKFWLPESDTIVHNCDDHVILGCTLSILNGIPCRAKVTSATKTKKDDYSHIYAVHGVPKENPKSWISADTTLPGRDNYGHEAPYGKALNFVA